MTKLERCPDYYRKLDFLEAKEIPIQTEIKLRIGLDLSDRIFETTDPKVKELLGTRPLVKGPGDTLWVSPSDLLIDYVRLKPPLTNKYIQALTHQGILEIGSEIEKKFIKKVQDGALLQLKSLNEMLKYLAKRDVKQAIHCTILKLKEQFVKYLEELDKDFVKKLDEALDKQKADMLAQQEIAVLEAKLEMKHMIQLKMEELVSVTVKKIIAQYADVLEQQSQKWHDHFVHHMKLAEAYLDETLEKKRARYKDRLKELYSDLQSDFIANMMYIICSERRKCQCEKKEIIERETAKILSLQEELKETQQKLIDISAESGLKSSHVKSREDVLFSIIKQFQKFIYFVLKANPQQAEYLLDIEKLMIFELTKATMEQNPEMFKGASLLDLTKRCSRSASSRDREADEDLFGDAGDDDLYDLLKVPDYHACDNIQRVDHSAHTLKSSEDLPAFRYGSNIYVREDFRNMISQGLEISKSNEHWNWDVEDLTKLLTLPHGVCLQDQDGEKFPCLRTTDETSPVCPSSAPLPTTPMSTPRKRFYETCIGPCAKQEAKSPAYTERICDLTCIKETVEGFPCDLCCQMSDYSIKPKPIEVDKPYKSDSNIQMPEKEIQMISCRSCALLRQGELPKKVEVVCDCYPQVDHPSLSEIKKATDNLIMESRQSTIFDKKVSELLPLPKSKLTPLHFATNSREIIRQSIQKKELMRKEDRERKRKKSLTMETKIKSIEVPEPVYPIKMDTSKISSAKDSVELMKAQSNISAIEKTWARTKDKVSIGSSESNVMDYRTLGQMTNYLEKLKRQSNRSNRSRRSTTSTIHSEQHQQTHYRQSEISTARRKSAVFVSAPDPPDLGEKVKMPNKIIKVAPRVNERVGKLIEDLRNCEGLRKLFLGTR